MSIDNVKAMVNQNISSLAHLNDVTVDSLGRRADRASDHGQEKRAAALGSKITQVQASITGTPTAPAEENYFIDTNINQLSNLNNITATSLENRQHSAETHGQGNRAAFLNENITKLKASIQGSRSEGGNGIASA